MARSPFSRRVNPGQPLIQAKGVASQCSFFQRVIRRSAPSSNVTLCSQFRSEDDYLLNKGKRGSSVASVHQTRHLLFDIPPSHGEQPNLHRSDSRDEFQSSSHRTFRVVIAPIPLRWTCAAHLVLIEAGFMDTCYGLDGLDTSTHVEPRRVGSKPTIPRSSVKW